jgi:hypothetical protein
MQYAVLERSSGILIIPRRERAISVMTSDVIGGTRKDTHATLAQGRDQGAPITRGRWLDPR